MNFMLLALLLLSFPIITIVALVIAVGVRDRVRRLEDHMAALERRISAAPTVAMEPEPAQSTITPEPVAPPIAEPMKTAAMASPAEPEPSVVSPVSPTATLAAPERIAGLEERFGTRWVVWVGGVALALGGIFLVRYSIEQGLIGPGMRLFSGALLAASLIAAGEWLRRQEKFSGFAGLPSAHIPSILTAAGTTVAYATVYAAYGLYGYLTPAFAFALLGVVALATLTAALLHGPALAALGLIGAYVTPLLVSTHAPNYWALYIYLAVVSAAAFALARIRLWRWLALTAVVFGFLWILPGIADNRFDSLSAHVVHVIVGFALVAAMLVSGLFYGPPATPGQIDNVSSIAVAAYLFAAVLLVSESHHDPLALGAFTVLTVATIGIAWRADAAAAAVPVAAGLAAFVIMRWAFDADLTRLIAPAGIAGVAAPQPLRASVGTHLALGGGYAVLFGAVGFLAQGRSVTALVPILWSAAGVLAPLAILIALYYRIAGLERSIPFAGLALLLAALFAVATEQLSKRTPRPGLATASALFATGAAAALALAFTFALEKGWLTIGLALMAPGVAWIAEKRPLPLLRWLAAALVVLVLLRIGWEPRIVGADVGTTPIVNWLLYGYGVPAASFWYAGHLLRRRADDQPARMVDAAAILFTVLLAFLEIRHLMNDGDVYRASGGLAEVAMQVCVGLAMAIGLERVCGRTKSIVHNIAAEVIAGLSFVGIMIGLGGKANPLLTGKPVGGPVFNLILLGYGLPAALTIALALITRGRRPKAYSVLTVCLALGLALAYLTLEVTTLYHGPVLTRGATSNAEQYTYSVVWLAFGVVLLLAGLALRSQPARLASAAIVALTVGKVFLIDMADLAGVYRALSFIGLGLVLVGIGWLYQRLLFPQRAPAASSPAGAPPTG
jgi:uncharacterized membrane protein